eukprot:g15637.t1
MVMKAAKHPPSSSRAKSQRFGWPPTAAPPLPIPESRGGLRKEPPAGQALEKVTPRMRNKRFRVRSRAFPVQAAFISSAVLRCRKISWRGFPALRRVSGAHHGGSRALHGPDLEAPKGSVWLCHLFGKPFSQRRSVQAVRILV